MGNKVVLLEQGIGTVEREQNKLTVQFTDNETAEAIDELLRDFPKELAARVERKRWELRINKDPYGTVLLQLRAIADEMNQHRSQRDGSTVRTLEMLLGNYLVVSSKHQIRELKAIVAEGLTQLRDDNESVMPGPREIRKARQALYRAKAMLDEL